MAINISVQYNGGLLPDSILLTQPRLLQSGNPFKYNADTLSLQPMKHYIITTMLDLVLHCFCFVFAFCLVSLDGD